MAKKIFQNYDFAGNQILDFRVENLGANPTASAARAGRLFFNTSTSVLAMDIGGSLKPLLTDVDWSIITGKPTTFAPSTHTHAQSEVTGLTTALGLLAPLASPALTGNPTAPTQAPGNNTTRLATTAFVTAAVGASGGGDMLKSVYDSTNNGKVDLAEVAEAAPWAGITGKPTTIAGFGITDAGALATKDTVATADIDNAAVTLAKMANIATARIIGRVTASTGVPEALTAAQVKSMLGITIADVLTLQTTLDGKSATSHTHVAANITDLAAAVDARIIAYLDTEAGADNDLDTLRELIDQIKANRDGLLAQIGRYNQDIGNGVATSIAVTHNLASLDVTVEVYEKATGDTVEVGVSRTSTNVVTIEAFPAPATNALRVVIKK